MSDDGVQESEIHLRFRAVRREKNLNQREFAQSIGLKQANYSSFELGNSNITVQTLAAAITVYNLNPNWLLFGLGNRYNEPNSTQGEYPIKAELKQIKVSLQDILKRVETLETYL